MIRDTLRRAGMALMVAGYAYTILMIILTYGQIIAR